MVPGIVIRAGPPKRIVLYLPTQCREFRARTSTQGTSSRSKLILAYRVNYTWYTTTCSNSVRAGNWYLVGKFDGKSATIPVRSRIWREWRCCLPWKPGCQYCAYQV